MRAPFIEGGNVDIIQADLTHFGGFTGMRRLAGWTEAHYLALAPHNVGGPVATAANVHFAVGDAERRHPRALQRLRRRLGERAGRRRATGRSGRRLLRRARSGPGLGLRLDHDACARHPRTGARLQLFVEGWQKRDGG